MTFVGHALTGAAVGVAVLPRGVSSVHKTAHLVLFILLANLPDLPVGDWGHGLYFYSHSLLANLLFVLLTALLLSISQRLHAKIGGWPVLLGGAAAWFSHLLLDSFYNHGLGVGLFWPFSEARLSLPIPWFSVMYGGLFPFTAEKARILLVEAANYLPLLAAVIIARAIRFRKTGRQTLARQ